MADYYDASAVVALLFEEPDSEAVKRNLQATVDAIYVSDFVIAEASSAVSRLVRVGAAELDRAGQLLTDLDDWIAANAETQDIVQSDFFDTIDLVRQFDLKLRAPDALHLAIARRLDARLVTLDVNLAAAAEAVGASFINPARS